MKRIFAFSALLLFGAACSEDANTADDPAAVQAENFEDIQTSGDFTWSTQVEYTLQVEGLSTLPFPKRDMLIILDTEGQELHRRLVEISQTRKVRFEAPAGLEFLTVKFGNIEKTVSLSGTNKGNFDYLPEVDDSDLDPDNL